MAKIPGFYTLDEAAEVLGVSRSQVSRYLSREDSPLKAINLGKQKLIEQGSVHKFKRPPMGNPAFLRGK